MAITAPSIGPAIVEVFGLRLPIAALFLALVGLILSRYIAPKSSRKLTLGQERALTVLLGLILFLIVIGEFPLVGDGTPLGVGMATAWGVGIGTSGLLTVELVGSRIMAGIKAALGLPAPEKPEG